VEEAGEGKREKGRGMEEEPPPIFWRRTGAGQLLTVLEYCARWGWRDAWSSASAARSTSTAIAGRASGAAVPDGGPRCRSHGTQPGSLTARIRRRQRTPTLSVSVRFLAGLEKPRFLKGFQVFRFLIGLLRFLKISKGF